MSTGKTKPPKRQQVYTLLVQIGRKDGDGLFRDRPVWAPDSSRFAAWKTRDVDEYQVHYIESSPGDQLQPKHFTRPYPKPGDEIEITVNYKEPLGQFHFLKGTIRKDGKVAMTVEFALAMIPAKA